jgi:DNA-binding transcriptional MerR regulator
MRTDTVKSAGESDRLLRPIEVRKLYGVVPSTLRNWAAAGKIRAAQRTAGGHRRYWESEVRSLLATLEAAVA